MIANTINNARTIAGNAEGVLLANRYRIIRQLGQGGPGGGSGVPPLHWDNGRLARCGRAAARPTYFAKTRLCVRRFFGIITGV